MFNANQLPVGLQLQGKAVNEQKIFQIAPCVGAEHRVAFETADLDKSEIENRKKAGADDGIRTRDLRFTKPLLYQLSYVGEMRGKATFPRKAEQAISRRCSAEFQIAGFRTKTALKDSRVSMLVIEFAPILSWRAPAHLD